MKRPFATALAAPVALASLLCAPGLASAQTTYTLTQVGDNLGDTNVTGINDEGDLALTVNNGPAVNTYLWHRGTETNIGGLAPSPQFVESGGLNDLVRIVGSTISPTSGNFCAFLWQQGHMVELPSPDGSQVVFGIQINLLGQIAGIAYDENFNGQAVIWTQGKPTVLPGLPGSDFAQPVGINIRGEMTGYANDANNTPNTVLWKQGTVTVLVPNSMPTGINDEGQVVGTTRTTPSLPFVWQNGVTTTLPPLPGLLPYGAAQSINDLGQIVGTSSNFPVLWQKGTAINLNNQIAPTDPLQPYVHLQTATLINNLGQIVATGTDSRNSALPQWYLLTPTR
jgi:uncharacterized membrane protein